MWTHLGQETGYPHGECCREKETKGCEFQPPLPSGLLPNNAELPVSTASRWAPPMHLPFPRSACSLLTREMPTFSCPLQPDMSKTNTPGLEHVSPNHYKSKKKKLDSSRQQIIYFQLSCSTCCTNSSTDGEVTCSKVAQNLDTFDTYCDDRTSEQVRFPNPDVFLMILQKK